MPSDPDRAVHIQRLQDEIRVLIDEQRKAIRSAVFVPMTSEEEIAWDERRDKITRLLEDLSDLCER